MHTEQVSAATTNSETGAPATAAPSSPVDTDHTASVRSIAIRFTLASSAVLAIIPLAAIRAHGEIAPLAIAVLAILLAVQIPFMWQMAGALGAIQRERDVLLHHAARTSQSVRHQIAADLHDSIAQDLTGVSFSLAALGRNQSIDPAAVAEAAESLRTALGSFRFVLDETLLDC